MAYSYGLQDDQEVGSVEKAHSSGLGLPYNESNNTGLISEQIQVRFHFDQRLATEAFLPHIANNVHRTRS